MKQDSNPENVVKEIELDDQIAPHNWKCEVEALKQVAGNKHVISLIGYEVKRGMDPTLYMKFPKLQYTLENVVFDNAKANYPPGSGWRNAMPFDRKCRIMRGVLNGLAHIHKFGIIHRDLKPENIMFNQDGEEPVIIDFGISWVPGVSEELENNKVTDVGSYCFKAPEILLAVANYTTKVDIWSAGCILAWLLHDNCEMLFAPYTNDFALLNAQFECLGIPNFDNCPTYRSTSACEMFGGQQTPGRGWVWSLMESNRDQLTNLLNYMLDFEPNNRLTASQLVERV